MNPDQPSALERQTAAFRPMNRTTLPAPDTVTIQPEEWTYDWPKKPVTPVVLGLRIPSTPDAERAESVGADAGPREETRQRAVSAFVVARCICDPLDINKGHAMFPMAEDEVPKALNPRTIERILERVADLMTRTVPLYPEANAEELTQLVTLLSLDDCFEGIPERNAIAARKYLRRALDELLGD